MACHTGSCSLRHRLDAARPPRRRKRAGSQGLSRPRHHPYRKPMQSGSADRQGPVHVHRPADEMARGHGLADPRRGGVRYVTRHQRIGRNMMLDENSLTASRRVILRAVGLLTALAAFGLGSMRAKAAGYPERPIKIIVPFAPGGPTDIMARVLSTHLGEALGGTVVVENKPGAGGNIGIGIAAHAEPDGYTLLITSSAYVVNPGLYAKIPYDPYQDFAPIAELATS